MAGRESITGGGLRVGILNGRRRRLRAAAAVFAVSLALGGCASLLGSKPIPTFDLSAPTGFSAPRAMPGVLAVSTPAALQVLDTQQIVVEPRPGQITYLGDAQWSDRLPALFQARLIETFENAGGGRSVTRAGDGVTADYQLLTDIRSFGLRTHDGIEAVVEISARIVAGSSGRIVAARVFTGRAAASGTSGPEATRALDEASDQALIELVSWASGRR
ncbi:membrane integrity-associated transporter subunit PqiC [Ancylobacter oerskovii]|nr:ABC-type transport auxiliary lipoprotein family protein [Ancylobacter oerskovii]MBS7546070.1 membrane integrity-associated transporter subunit PqiC [Ancylobacter oerskovii]